jgi:hypothetical protein
LFAALLFVLENFLLKILFIVVWCHLYVDIQGEFIMKQINEETSENLKEALQLSQEEVESLKHRLDVCEEDQQSGLARIELLQCNFCVLLLHAKLTFNNDVVPYIF